MNKLPIPGKAWVQALIFVLVPALLVLGFGSHPNLTDLNPVKTAEAWILEIRGNTHLLQAHIGVLLAVPLLVVLAGILKSQIQGPGRWLGQLGYALSLTGGVFLAADKGALCLVPAALETLDPQVLSTLVPVYQALLDKAGPLVLLNLLGLLPLGFIFLALGLWRSRVYPRWSLGLLMGAMVLFFNPDIDGISLAASLLMLGALGTMAWGLLHPRPANPGLPT